MMGILRTTLLMGLLTGLFISIGYFIGGNQGMLLFLVLAGVMNFISYFFSDKLVLAMYKAQEISEKKDPKLHRMVQKLANDYKIPKPKIYFIPTNTPNAFATGRSPKHAAVAVTAGIMEILTPDELEGVLAHELGHVKNRDTLISTIAATVAGAISYLGYALMFGGRDEDRNPLAAIVIIILAPLAAGLIQLAISRTREYAADKTGAYTSHKPLELASALQKIEKAVAYKPLEGNPNTAHLFIINPFSAERVAGLFSTHPRTSDRIEKLKQIAKELKE